jgi:acyl-lipid omega-6 desaturase (Delta-12 desaturase)
MAWSLSYHRHPQAFTLMPLLTQNTGWHRARADAPGGAHIGMRTRPRPTIRSIAVAEPIHRIRGHPHVSTSESLKQCRRAIAHRHVRPDDLKALAQVAATLVPIVILWYGLWLSAATSRWLAAAAMVLMTLFLLRVFVLMHECGHDSLFRSTPLNRYFGFVFGVIAGMPQFVWSQHHRYHHSTNGNWSRYQGPLNVIPVEQYAAMSTLQQRRYRFCRNIWLAPIGGLLYLIVTPRLTWIRCSAGLIRHVVARKLERPAAAIETLASEFTAPCCASLREYRHMFWNNAVLLGLWALMAWMLGPALFFACYLATLSIAGGVAIVLFTVQHNFEHSYASDDEGWDRNTAALEGTSFLILPGWLNWFTANIAYHHVHHLCARIPNYCLVRCHQEQGAAFDRVTRITLFQIPRALRYILWDTASRRLISVAEHLQQSAA